MSPEDLLSLGCAEAAAAMATGGLTAERYVSALVGRARECACLNALITLNTRLEEQARAVDLRRARGERMGPLAGVPLLIKDNIEVAGLPNTAGSPALRDWRPTRDAPVLARLCDAGALVLGKANMQELALGITSNNRAFGPVRNPYAPTLIAGGSSGGTAAGIAAAMAPGGLGSDTAGSIRIPAALCGVAGLRPTTGRYSQAGIVPLSHSRDTAGPMARSLADLMLLDEVITGERAKPDVSVRGLRLGLPEPLFWDDLDAELAEVCRAARSRLDDAGVIFAPVDVRAIVAIAEEIGRSLTLAECIPDLEAYLADSDAGLTAAEVIAGIASPDVAEGYAFARQGRVSPEAYQRARDVLQPQLRAAYAALFRREGIDALVFPATPLPARPVGQDTTVELNSRQVDTRATYLRNTEHGALAGLPGLVLPAGSTRSGLPVGLELDGPAGCDRRLLAIGAALERILGRPEPVLSPIGGI